MIREGTSRPDKRIHDHSSGKLCHLTEREIAEAEQVTTINVKTGEQTA